MAFTLFSRVRISLDSNRSGQETVMVEHSRRVLMEQLAPREWELAFTRIVIVRMPLHPWLSGSRNGQVSAGSLTEDVQVIKS